MHASSPNAKKSKGHRNHSCTSPISTSTSLENTPSRASTIGVKVLAPLGETTMCCQRRAASIVRSAGLHRMCLPSFSFVVPLKHELKWQLHGLGENRHTWRKQLSHNPRASLHGLYQEKCSEVVCEQNSRRSIGGELGTCLLR